MRYYVRYYKHGIDTLLTDIIAKIFVPSDTVELSLSWPQFEISERGTMKCPTQYIQERVLVFKLPYISKFQLHLSIA